MREKENDTYWDAPRDEEDEEETEESSDDPQELDFDEDDGIVEDEITEDPGISQEGRE